MRFTAHLANPPYVWDSLQQKVSSTHTTYESASTRAYILNRYSTGSYAGGAR